MKKVTYLLVLMFSVTLMSTSCDKDEPIVPDTKTITVADLEGDWNFEKLEIFDATGIVLTKTYTGGCSDELDALYNYGAISILNVVATPESKANFLDICSEGVNGIGGRGNIGVTNNEIDIDGSKIFIIENADTFNGTVLKLKLKWVKEVKNAPIGGIYTLKHKYN